MNPMPPTRRLAVAAVAAAAFYACFVLFPLRDIPLGLAGHGKALGFAVLLTAAMFAALAAGEKLRGRSNGFRVAVGAAAVVACALLTQTLQALFRHDPVWHKLWDLPLVVLILPLAQGMFGRPKPQTE